MGENKILAFRSRVQKDTGLREQRGEVKRLKSGHPASSSDKEGERPRKMSSWNKRKKRSAEIQRKCFEHAIRAVVEFKGTDEDVERMQEEIWQRELVSEEKRGTRTIVAIRVTISILKQFL